MTSTTILAAQVRTLPTQLAVVLIGSWVLAASSWIEVPMWPVPMTAQTCAVLMIGAVCGWRLAAYTVAAYLAQGALGLPMFAGGAAGAHHLVGPTGGYLVGFLIAATLVGWLTERGWGRTWLGLAGAMTIAHALIFATGVGWLALLIGGEQAIAAGLTPFILGSIIKIAAAVATVRAGQAFLAGR